MEDSSQVTFKESSNETRALSPWSMTFTCSLIRTRKDSCTGTISKWWQKDWSLEQGLNSTLGTYIGLGVFMSLECFQEFVMKTLLNLMETRAQVAIIFIRIL